MIVVVHEAIAVTQPVEPLNEFSKEPEKIEAISVVSEDVLPCIPARRHVIERAGIFNPERPSHNQILQETVYDCKT
jgi:hypothetical protein